MQGVGTQDWRTWEHGCLKTDTSLSGLIQGIKNLGAIKMKLELGNTGSWEHSAACHGLMYVINYGNIWSSKHRPLQT